MGRALVWLKDLLFPRFCVNCREEGVWLCDKCVEVIVKTEKLSSEKQNLVAPHLDGVTALFHYGDKNISKLIGMLKYNSLVELRKDFKKIITHFFPIEEYEQAFQVLGLDLKNGQKGEIKGNKVVISGTLNNR